MMAKFWTRIPHERREEWRLVEGNDESGVPVAVWKVLNREFWKRRARGEFYPLDAIDAYQIACRELVSVAREHRSLRTASMTTYLVSVAFNKLKNYRDRDVGKTRAAYHDAPSLDAQALVESIPGGHSAVRLARRRSARREAREFVWRVLPRLDADAQSGLRAFLEAKGVYLDAARIYNPEGSVQGYMYRFKCLWAPAFRKEAKRRKGALA